MAPLRFTTFTAAQIRELAERSFEIMRETYDAAVDFDGEAADRMAANEAREVAESALWFCGRAIAQLGDPSLASLALRLADEYAGVDGLAEESQVGLRGLIEARLLAPAHLRAVLRARSADPRLTLVGALPLDWAPAPRLLASLCADPDPRVRAAAAERAALARKQRDAFKALWTDLRPMLRPEAARYRATVAQLAQALEACPGPGAPRALELASGLPAPACCEVIRRVAQQVAPADLPPAAGRALAGAGEAGEATLMALLEDFRGVELAAQFLRALPEPERLRKMLGWLERLAPAALPGPTQVLNALAFAIAECWPEDRSALPVVEVVLARARALGSADPTFQELAWVMGHNRRPQPALPRLAPLLVAGFPGPFAALRPRVEAYLERLRPTTLRELASAARASASPDSVAWGIRVGLGRARPPGIAPAELAAQFDDDPSLRPVLRERQAWRILPRLRRELVAGQLDFPIAARTLRAIGQMHGGLLEAERRDWAADGHPPAAKGRVGARRQAFRAHLEPGRGLEPPTEDEWRAYRRLRDAHPFASPDELLTALELLPPGGVAGAEDRAFVLRALSSGAATGAGAVRIGAILALTGGLEDLGLFGQLAPGTGDDQATLEKMRKTLRRRLGFSLDPAQPHLTVVGRSEGG